MSGMLALGNNVELKKQRKNWKFKQNIKFLENEIKVEIKQAKKVITRVYLKKIKTVYQKLEKLFAVLSMWEEKVNVLHAP